MDMMEYLDMAKEYYEKAKKAVTKTETERKLSEALSRHNWGASSTELREIARLTFDWHEYGVVMKKIWSVLQYPGSKWRQVFKALTLLDFLIKNGAERVVEDAREHMFQIKTLKDFTYYHEQNEKGAGIREKAKQLLELLSDTELIREERERAKMLRDKFTGMGKDGIPRTDQAFNGGSYDSGVGYGGRYGDSNKGTYRDSIEKDSNWEDEFVKKKNGATKSQRRNVEETRDARSRSGSDHEQEFDPFENFEDDSKNDVSRNDAVEFDVDDDYKDNSKNRKSKLTIKINDSSDNKAKAKPHTADADLLGEPFSSDRDDAQPIFDPFDDGNDGWTGFETGPNMPKQENNLEILGYKQEAKIVNKEKSFQNEPVEDIFGDLVTSTSTPSKKQTGSSDFNLWQGSTSGSPDLLGITSSNFAGGPKTVGKISTSQNHMSQNFMPSAQSSDALWGSGLVDLQNLSLNTKTAQPSLQPSKGNHNFANISGTSSVSSLHGPSRFGNASGNYSSQPSFNQQQGLTGTSMLNSGIRTQQNTNGGQASTSQYFGNIMTNMQMNAKSQ